MGLKVVAVEETPNPNALKWVLSGVVSAAPRSFRSAENAKGDALARELFAIPGVVCVLICNDFVTVNKSPETQWKTVRAAVKKVLERAAP